MSYQDPIWQVLKTGSPVNPGLPDPLASIVLAQTAHESGGYTSNVFRVDNNTNGYKFVGSRYQSGYGLKSPEGDYYGHYRTLQDNIYELVDWIYRRRNEGVFPDLRTITTPDQYALLLKKAGYFGDNVENYTAGLKRWLSQNPAAVGIGGGLLTIGVFYLIYRSLKKAG